jgi:hypothetical protein
MTFFTPATDAGLALIAFITWRSTYLVQRQQRQIADLKGTNEAMAAAYGHQPASAPTAHRPFGTRKSAARPQQAPAPAPQPKRTGRKARYALWTVAVIAVLILLAFGWETLGHILNAISL